MIVTTKKYILIHGMTMKQLKNAFKRSFMNSFEGQKKAKMFFFEKNKRFTAYRLKLSIDRKNITLKLF